MTAKKIGREDFLGNSLLPGVDQFGLWTNGGNLLQVARLNRVTEHNSHGDALGKNIALRVEILVNSEFLVTMKTRNGLRCFSPGLIKRAPGAGAARLTKRRLISNHILRLPNAPLSIAPGQENFVYMRRFGILTVILLVGLRLAIGWHFFHVGLSHFNDKSWSSEGFLRGAKGPLAGSFQAVLPPRPADKWQQMFDETVRVTMGSGSPSKLSKSTNSPTVPAKGDAGKGKDDTSKASLPKPDATAANQANGNIAAGDEPDQAEGSSEKSTPAEKPAEQKPGEKKAEPPALGKVPEAIKPDEDNKSAERPPEKSPAAASTAKPKEAVKAADKKSELDLAVADWHAQIVADWQHQYETFVGDYPLDDQQKQDTQALLNEFSDRARDYLNDQAKDAGEFRHLAERLGQLERVAGAQQIRYQAERIAKFESDLKSKSAGWAKELGGLEESLRGNWFANLTEGQRKSVIPADNILSRINLVVEYLILGVGACLLLGLFTRLASLAGALFLFSVILSQLWDPFWATKGEAPYVPVEMFALLVLSTTLAGRWGGLDFFIHYLIVRPIVTRREIL